MQQAYDEMTGDISELSDDEMYFHHVIQGDHELLALDMILRNAVSPVND